MNNRRITSILVPRIAGQIHWF